MLVEIWCILERLIFSQSRIMRPMEKQHLFSPPQKKIYIGKIDAVSCLLIRLWSGLRGNGCSLWLDEFEYVGSSLFHFRYNGTSLQKLQF